MFYPDIVTLAPAADVAEAWRLVDDSPGCSVKDSFAALDLTTEGFEALFDAEWIVLESDSSPTPDPSTWHVLDGEGDLATWSLAHGATAAFGTSLLSDPSVRFIATWDNDGVAAGAIVNRSRETVGVSNVFSPRLAADAAWAGVVATVGQLFPGVPLVGYERGADLDAAQAAGFSIAGPLRVWLRPGRG